MLKSEKAGAAATDISRTIISIRAPVGANKDKDNEDYNNNHNQDEYGGPNCDVRVVLQFCDVLLHIYHFLM